MTDLRTAAQQALEFIEIVAEDYPVSSVPFLTALRAALEQPKQEPWPYPGTQPWPYPLPPLTPEQLARVETGTRALHLAMAELDDTALLRRCLGVIQCSGVKHPDLLAERDQLERDLRERLGEAK